LKHLTALKLVNFRANVNFFFAYLQAQTVKSTWILSAGFLYFSAKTRKKSCTTQTMKRFAFILTLFGGGFLLSSIALLILPFDPNSLQKILTSDGSFDPLAVYAFGSINSGLCLAGLTLLMLSWLFHHAAREQFSPLNWSSRKFVLILLGIQFLISIIYVTVVQYVPNGDSEWYHRQAINLAKGIGVVTQVGEPTAFWPVGYPLLISFFYRIFGETAYTAQIVNVFFLCGSTLLIYLITKNIFGEKVARTTALITAFIPSQIFYALNPMADIPFAFLVILLIYLTIRPQSLTTLTLIGLVWGYTNLLRPTILFFPVVMVGYWLLEKRQVRQLFLRMIIIIAVGELVMLPWQVRNYKVFNQFILSANYAGYNLAMGNNPNASGGVMSPRQFVPPEKWDYYRSLNEAEQDRFLLDVGKQYILSHPGRSIILAIRKFIHLYYKDSKCITYGLSETYQQFPAAVIMCLILTTEGYYYTLGLVFLLALWFFIQENKQNAKAWILLATIVYFTLIFLPFTAEGRYHMPLLPIFALIISFTGCVSSSRNAPKLQ
jgi:hypothetical protein